MKSTRKNAKGAGNWAKSSAFVSLIVHVLVFLVAGSIVAVKLNVKEDVKFEGHKRARPKMKMKKLQIPVQVKKMQKPRKAQVKTRLTVKNVKMKSSMPELKLSDKVSGSSLGGSSIAGMGNTLGGAGSLGFSLSTVDFMGVKSKGEKICFLIDTKNSMVTDKKGGLWAYDIVKRDIIKNINRLGSTTLFNVIAYNNYHGKTTTYTYKPGLITASKTNKAGFEKWLSPINKSGAGAGVKNNYKPASTYKPLTAGIGGYIRALQAAIEMKADVIYLFTSDLESHRINNPSEAAKASHQKAMAAYKKATAAPKTPEEKAAAKAKATALKKKQAEVRKKAKQLLAAHQKARKDKGLPPDQGVNERSFYGKAGGMPQTPRPPIFPKTWLTPDHMWTAARAMIKEEYLLNDLKPPVINVIIFAGKDEKPNPTMIKSAKRMASNTKGRCTILKGLSAKLIQDIMEGKASAADLKKAASK